MYRFEERTYTFSCPLAHCRIVPGVAGINRFTHVVACAGHPLLCWQQRRPATAENVGIGALTALITLILLRVPIGMALIFVDC